MQRSCRVPQSAWEIYRLITLNMNRINASFYSFEQVIIFNEGKSRSLRKNRRSLLRIITNCSISVTPVRDLRKNSPVETLTNRRLDWSWSVTKLKAFFQTPFVEVFLLLVKQTKFKIFIGFFSHRQDSIFYSNGGSAKNYWVSLSVVFYKIDSIHLYFEVFLSRFKQL